MNEFDIIKEIFAPLTRGNEGAFNLKDDAAVLRPQPGKDFVITSDALVAGVHFFPDDPPQLIAAKAVRVNVSDLAAKAAQPVGYLMSIALPGTCDRAWLDAFATGLGADQKQFGLSLYGGDTVSTPGPLTISITMFGTVDAGGMIQRSGARPGDLVFVTGTVGDAGLGLKIVRGDLASTAERDRQILVDRYRVPQPRVQMLELLTRLANAACDVSDGLIADAAHIAHASAARIDLDAEAVPLSASARACRTRILDLATSGDDYEILFTAAAENAEAIDAYAEQIGIRITKIGRVIAGDGAHLLDANGNEVEVRRSGFDHRDTYS